MVNKRQGIFLGYEEFTADAVPLTFIFRTLLTLTVFDSESKHKVEGGHYLETFFLLGHFGTRRLAFPIFLSSNPLFTIEEHIYVSTQEGILPPGTHRRQYFRYYSFISSPKWYKTFRSYKSFLRIGSQSCQFLEVKIPS
jgi:hypothetical protein